MKTTLKNTLSRIKRRRVIRRKKSFLDRLSRTVGPIEEVTLDSDYEEENVPVPSVENKPRCSPVESSTPISKLPRLTREQFEAMWTESSSEKEEEDGAPPTLPREDQQDPEDVRPSSKDSSQYHPTTPLGDESSEEENIGVYAKEQCSIPAGMGRYIPVQTSHEIQGDVLVEIRDKTLTGLILPEIVYNVKKKLGCIL